MKKIYKGQSALRIIVNTLCNLDDAITGVIKFRKPDGSCGEFSANMGDREKGVLWHDVAEGEIDVSGWWVFWAFVTFSDGRIAAGEAAKVFVWNMGNG